MGTTKQFNATLQNTLVATDKLIGAVYSGAEMLDNIAQTGVQISEVGLIHAQAWNKMQHIELANEVAIATIRAEADLARAKLEIKAAAKAKAKA